MRYVATAALLLTMILPARIDARSHIYSGYAARYRPGLMEQVARNRHMPQEPCMIAATHEPLGAQVRVTSGVTGVSLLCRVVDQPHPRHRASIIRRGIIAELSHQGAKKVCGTNNGSPRECPINIGG
jgi:hypothetical protein